MMSSGLAEWILEFKLLRALTDRIKITVLFLREITACRLM